MIRTGATLSFMTMILSCGANVLRADPQATDPKAPPTSPAAAPPAGAPAQAEGATLDGSALADALEHAFAGQAMPESAQMLAAIARGSQMGPGEGWFGPAQTRYTWPWLAQAHGMEPTAEITKEQFRGDAAWFDRLDRNKDGRIAGADLDWSDRNPYVQQFNLANRMLRRVNRKGDGRLTRDDLLALFDQAARGRDYVTTVDLAETLLAGFGGFAPDDAPTPEVLIRGLFRGEIGSLNEGPRVDARAPDFCLKTQDGKRTICLSELRGTKPIVLVFGNFTCGPFRSMYPLVDDLKQRYQDKAEFLAVYVREAHPADGWRMGSNARAGVELAQPKTYEERVSAAEQCHAMLNYSMPLVVDEINDPVGNSYSGMPARLYVIDRNGKVAYKSGRGPFGFNPDSWEEAIRREIQKVP